MKKNANKAKTTNRNIRKQFGKSTRKLHSSSMRNGVNGGLRNKTKCKDEIDCNITSFPKFPNKIWNTCISLNGETNHILYVTPINVVIKSVDTYQTPTFIVRVMSKGVQGNRTLNCSIAIYNNYVSCILRYCSEWYVILIQKNSLLYNNFVYYKLNGVKNVINTEIDAVNFHREKASFFPVN